MRNYIFVVGVLLCAACARILPDTETSEHGGDKPLSKVTEKISRSHKMRKNLPNELKLPEGADFTLMNHAMVHHHLSIIRNKNTKSSDFRSSVKIIAALLVYEGTKTLPLAAIDVKTPITKTTCYCIDPHIKIFIVSILRAGLGITSVAEDIIPDAVIQLLGMYRDEKTHRPVWYYNKLPATFDNPSDIKVFICDPMLATGGSAYETIKMYIDKGIKEENITFLCVISAPEGVRRLFKAFPHIKIIAASLDDGLDKNAYIIPGLGDAGDRLFNSVANSR